MPRKQPGPPCQICGKPSVAKFLCETHYRRLKRHGHFEQSRPADWGRRSKHPLWQSWKWMNRAGHLNGWADFWAFVADVGAKPGDRYWLKRRDEDKPFGPGNWYWREPVSDIRTTEGREQRNAYMRAWHAKNPIKKKENDLKKHFGMSIAEYAQLLHSQENVCAICGTKDEYFSLAVDHCHGTNKVRGLLCSQCNRGIGMFRDNPDLLEKAAKYLRYPKRLI